MAGTDLLGEVAEQIGFLSVGVTVTGFGYGIALRTRVHPKITPAHLKIGVVDIETHFVSREGQDEIGQFHAAVSAADFDPLLGLGEERTVEVGRNAIVKEQRAGELGRHVRRAVGAAGLGK